MDPKRALIWINHNPTSLRTLWSSMLASRTSINYRVVRGSRERRTSRKQVTTNKKNFFRSELKIREVKRFKFWYSFIRATLVNFRKEIGCFRSVSLLFYQLLLILQLGTACSNPRFLESLNISITIPPLHFLLDHDQNFVVLMHIYSFPCPTLLNYSWPCIKVNKQQISNHTKFSVEMPIIRVVLISLS